MSLSISQCSYESKHLKPLCMAKTRMSAGTPALGSSKSSSQAASTPPDKDMKIAKSINTWGEQEGCGITGASVVNWWSPHSPVVHPRGATLYYEWMVMLLLLFQLPFLLLLLLLSLSVMYGCGLPLRLVLIRVARYIQPIEKLALTEWQQPLSRHLRSLHPSPFSRLQSHFVSLGIPLHTPK